MIDAGRSGLGASVERTLVLPLSPSNPTRAQGDRKRAPRGGSQGSRVGWVAGTRAQPGAVPKE
jgi:hypothetical protein